MTQEQAAAALHAAKMAQLGAMGHNLDKLPMPNHNNNNNNNNINNNYDILAKMQQTAGLTIESAGGKRESPETEADRRSSAGKDRLEIRRGGDSDLEPMDLGLDQTINTSNSNNGQSLQTDSIGGASSSAEEGNYSEDEGHGNA